MSALGHKSSAQCEASGTCEEEQEPYGRVRAAGLSGRANPPTAIDVGTEVP